MCPPVNELLSERHKARFSVYRHQRLQNPGADIPAADEYQVMPFSELISFQQPDNRAQASVRFNINNAELPGGRHLFKDDRQRFL